MRWRRRSGKLEGKLSLLSNIIVIIIFLVQFWCHLVYWSSNLSEKRGRKRHFKNVTVSVIILSNSDFCTRYFPSQISIQVPAWRILTFRGRLLDENRVELHPLSNGDGFVAKFPSHCALPLIYYVFWLGKTVFLTYLTHY